MSPIGICAAMVLTPLPPLHEAVVQEFSRDGVAWVEMPKSLSDTLGVNRAEGKLLATCLMESKVEAQEERRKRIEAEAQAAVTRDLERRVRLHKTVATVAVVGAGVAFVGGVYVGALAVSEAR